MSGQIPRLEGAPQEVTALLRMMSTASLVSCGDMHVHVPKLHVAGDGRPFLPTQSGQRFFLLALLVVATCLTKDMRLYVFRRSRSDRHTCIWPLSDVREGATIPTRVCGTAWVAPETPSQWANHGTLHQPLVLNGLADELGLRHMIGQVLRSP